jgi:hypothetical protein
MPVSGASVEKPAEKGRKTRIEFKLAIFFVSEGYGAGSGARFLVWGNKIRDRCAAGQRLAGTSVRDQRAGFGCGRETRREKLKGP